MAYCFEVSSEYSFNGVFYLHMKNYHEKSMKFSELFFLGKLDFCVVVLLKFCSIFQNTLIIIRKGITDRVTQIEFIFHF